jgi:hypothetical protein
MNADQPIPTDAPALRPARSRLARWLRRGVIALGSLCVLGLLGLWLATRSWFIIWQVRPVLERKLGGEVTIARADYDGGGRVTFRDIRLKARGLSGPAAEVAVIGRCFVNVSVGELLTGNVEVEDLELADVTVRMSEAAREPGKMNFQYLTPKRGGTDRPPTPPSRVRLENLILEVGVHEGAAFVANGRRRMAGQMEPIAGQEGWFNFDLREVNETGQVISNGLLVNGEWSADTLEAHSRIRGIPLDERVFSMLPQQARLAWNQMQLQGRVDNVRVDWQPDAPLSVHFNVKDVALTLPIELQELWSLYRNGAVEETSGRPRMKVHEGDIRVGTDSLALDLTGEVLNVNANGSDMSVVGVPYHVSLNVPALPEISWDAPERWMEEALKTAAFEADISLENFSLRSDAVETQAVGLPTIVARTLAKFQTTGWVLSSSVHVSRAEPLKQSDGSLKPGALAMNGQAYINKASGKYHKFPYLLDDVYAYLHFDTQRVVVEYLNGRGSDGSTFQIKGVIEPPDKDAGFKMQVTGLNVPMDDRFKAALKANELMAVEALFNHSSADRLARAGLLPDADMLARQDTERSELAARLAQIKHGADADAALIATLEQRIAQLDRSIAAGPFTAGATINLDLTVTREPGPQKPAHFAGAISLAGGGLIFDRFPYPLRASAGRLLWDGDRVSIDPGPDGVGIPFVTPAGGFGSVTGTIDFPKIEGNRKVRPDLTFVIEDDPDNATIYAAVPYSKKEAQEHPELIAGWPGVERSRAGRMVEGIGLGGAFDYHGRITSRADGKMTWDFRVTLDGGTAAPNALLSREIKARAEPWPAGFTLRDLKGEVRVRREGVSWDQISGASGEATLTTSGLIDLRQDGDPDFVTVRMTNAPVDRTALNMVAASSAPRAEALWDRFQPSGRYDALLAYRSDAPAAQAAVVTIEPRDVTLQPHGRPVRVQSRQGSVQIDREQASFNDLMLELSGEAARPELAVQAAAAVEAIGDGGADDGAAPNQPDSGVLSLRGLWTFAGEQPAFDVSGNWARGRFDSPLIPEIMEVVGQQSQADRVREFDPAGVFDMKFRMARERPDMPADYRLDVRPQTVDFTLRDTRVSLTAERGQFVITPGFITLDQISGTTGAAAAADDRAPGRFSVDGGIKTSDPLDATLSLEHEGRLRGKDVAAFLPRAVNESLAALEFREHGVTRLERGWLHVRRTGAPGDSALPVEIAAQDDGAEAAVGADAADGRGWQTEFTGRVHTRDAEFVAGVRFTEVDGWLDLDVSHETGRPPRMSAVSKADHAVVLGKTLFAIEAPMSLNEAGDALEIPVVQARSGDGAITASATAGIGARRDYQMRLDLVGVPLGSLLSPRAATATQLDNGGLIPDASASTQPTAPPPLAPPPSAAQPAKPVTGQVYASLSLSGERGDASSKRGRGIFRVVNGHLSSIPLVLQALQVMQLTLPLSGGLDFADADLYIVGDTAHFEHILFESTVGDSAALQLLGEGTLDLTTMEVTARFRPRSGIAILRDIIGGIGDMLYEIEVTGPIGSPQARVVPLP